MAFANNTCDIERDKEAGRKTLSILLGRNNAAFLLKAVVIFDILLVAHIIFYNFHSGIFLILFMLIHILPTVSQLLKFNYTPDARMPALVNILKFNLLLNIYYMLMILASALVNI
jgi:1,4-dihydroxy-2-naphthoate octaprenyltransferase